MNAGRWDVVEVDFGGPAVGHEQAKRRPAVVISNDHFNRAAGLLTVLPITSRQTAKYPAEVEFDDMPGIVSRGVIMVHQIRTVSQTRVERVRGPLKDPVLQRRIVEAIAVFLDLPGNHA